MAFDPARNAASTEPTHGGKRLGDPDEAGELRLAASGDDVAFTALYRRHRAAVYRFAWLMAKGVATRHDAAVLKLYTGEAYKTVSDLGLQILGGYGYCTEYPMQRFFRDSRLATIGAGTSEIQRNIIARGLGL